MRPEDFVKSLEAISFDSGIPYRRAYALFDEEERHVLDALKYKGYLALSDAFKCFFLETVELLNTECSPKVRDKLPADYVLFVPRLTHSFQTLCGAERLAHRGYPYQAYSLLRNVFDALVLVSAALQKMTDFYSIEGVIPDEPYDENSSRKLRKNTEQEIRRRMTGNLSGLSSGAIDELKLWDAMFDWETHGGRLSLTKAVPWMKGTAPLSVLPNFDEKATAMFMNRYGEIAWALHRLIPFVQPPSVQIGGAWPGKWAVLDEAFTCYVGSLTEQLAKRIGAAIIEFINAKFPFRADTTFPIA